MNEDEFWNIVQRSFDKCSGDINEQAELLAEELEPLSPEEVCAFDRIFEEKRQRAFTRDLWGAAYIIGGGCSDDGFWYFLSWLISRGKTWYEKALENADSLAEYPGQLGEEGSEFEEFAYVAREAYANKAGDMPDHELPLLGKPTGAEWDEDDDESFRTRWPKLVAKYG